MAKNPANKKHVRVMKISDLLCLTTKKEIKKLLKQMYIEKIYTA